MNTNTAASQTVAILGYHKVGEPAANGWHTWNYVTAENFEKHLDYLRDNNWKVIGVETFLKGLDKPETLPERSALITFDDGYKSNLQIALPILKKYQYEAVIFVATKYVDSYNAFDADIFYEPKEQICSWEELRELHIQGVSIQSHSVSHPRFSELNEQQKLFELVESKKIIEEMLGNKVEFFSFPYGDDGVDEIQTRNLLLHAGYKTACLYGGGIFSPVNADLFRLQRIAIGADTNIENALI